MRLVITSPRPSQISPQNHILPDNCFPFDCNILDAVKLALFGEKIFVSSHNEAHPVSQTFEFDEQSVSTGTNPKYHSRFDC